MARLKDLAKVIRSKNAGPYEITFDIMFPDKETYDKVKNADVLNEKTICRLYRTTPENVAAMLFFAPALAFKFTLKRPGRSFQGSIGEHDTFGTQQHAPLLDIEIP